MYFKYIVKIMKNISYYDDYREVIKILAKEKPLSFKKIAENCQIHSSYFSRVMVDKADFSQEQLYKIGNELSLLEWEINYFLTLGEISNSGNVKHKNFLQQKINGLKKEHQKLEKNLYVNPKQLPHKDIETFYSDPLIPVIYTYLTIKSYRDNPESIYKKLGISKNQFNLELQKLQKLGVISIKEEEDIYIAIKVIHIDEANPIFIRFLMNRRIDSLAQIAKGPSRSNDYRFSVLFSTTEEKKKEIKSLFLEFVKKAQKTSIEGEKSRAKKDLCSINFDLY